MAKLTSKVALPIILVGLFAMVVFVALDYEKLEIGFYIVFFLLAIYVFFFGFATGQSFSSPVKKLLERANEIKSGNLSSRAYLETKDELSELARVFNEIAEDLESSHIQNENMEKSVDIKVRARTKSLEETINALEQKIKNRTIELQRLTDSFEKLQKENGQEKPKKEFENEPPKKEEPL
jgi:nitrate/nitrite-specific signal transduction histidine kinase